MIPMIPVSNLRPGTFFSDGKSIFEVLSYNHVKLGRGNAIIKVKARDLRKRAVVEKTFLSGSKVCSVELDKRQVQYLYHLDNAYLFMDKETFEQFSIDKKGLAEKTGYLSEGADITLLFHEKEPISIALPIKTELTVIDTSPGVKGDSATNIWKEATLETGLKLKVPLFIKVGDRLRVDTRTGEYMERVGR